MMKTDANELYEQGYATFTQLRWLNKPKYHNKHFAYLVTETENGQPFGANPGGVHRSYGQTKGQSLNPGRRGVE